MDVPSVALDALDTLWFQVGGTLCNLACRHCLVEASPTNRRHAMMTLEQIRPYLDEARTLGVKEYYFTGGEPFLNREMEAILERTLEQGPATVLTNGLPLTPERCRALRRLADASRYSLDLRISLDGYDAASNDPIRGDGSFDRIVAGVGHLVRAGLNPVITVTEVRRDTTGDEGRRRFLELMRGIGIDKPRLKVLPLFRIGAEIERGGGYADWQRVRPGDDAGRGFGHLQCSSSRTVTATGVWVCPILVNDPEARMADRLAPALRAYPLRHRACWTCHVEGASCRT